VVGRGSFSGPPAGRGTSLGRSERADVGSPFLAGEVASGNVVGGASPELRVEVPDLGGMRAVGGLAAQREKAAVEGE
jgi:hypothetical protein